ncbi:MAG: DNA repair exonuclease, partial [Planctomycetota bacterium]
MISTPSASRRFIHAADIHLDSPMLGLNAYENAPQEQLRGAIRHAFSNLIDLAIERSVDLVVIAGDLYDGNWNEIKTGLYFVGQVQRLINAGIPMVVIRGNHDAANKMTNQLRLPKNPDGSDILLDAEQVDRRVFDDLGIVVHGRSYRTRAETQDMTIDYPAPLRDLFNLGLLHTGLSGLQGHEPYAPVTPNRLADKGYDYWALGHIHCRGEHHAPGAAPIVYSGNIQGRHIRESGAKGCLLVDIDDQNQTTTTFQPLDVARWDDRCQIDTSTISHRDEIADQFDRFLKASLTDADQRLLVPRVRITGETPQHSQWVAQQAQIEADLQAVAIATGGDQVWLEKVRIKTLPPLSGHLAPGLDDDESVEPLAGPLD